MFSKHSYIQDLDKNRGDKNRKEQHTHIHTHRERERQIHRETDTERRTKRYVGFLTALWVDEIFNLVTS